MSVTFMAKFAADQRRLELPHPLQPVARRQERVPRRQDARPMQCSDAFRWFLGGWIAHVPDVMVFYAPTINSYKRYVDGSWAPTRLAWSHDNRTAGFRVVGSGQGPAHRVPHPGRGLQSLPRASPPRSPPGSTASRNKIEPPEHFSGDVYAARDLPRVPYTLGRSSGPLRGERFRQARFRRRRRRALPPLLPHRAERLQLRGDGLGAAAVLRTI